MRLPTLLAAIVLALPTTALAQTPDLRWPAGDRRPQRPHDGFVEADYTAPADGRTRVELASDGRPQWVLVERRLRLAATDRRGQEHEVIGSATCETPCVMYIPPGAVQVRTRGEGVRDASFDLEVPRERVAVVLRAPSRRLYDLGTRLVAIGAAMFVGEALVAAVSQGIAGSETPTPGALGHDGPLLTPPVALSLAIVAGSLLAVGIPLMVAHRTGVERRTRLPPLARWRPTMDATGLRVSF